MHIKFIQIFMHGSVRIMIIMQLATAPSHQRSLYQHEVGSFLRDGGQRSKTNIEADALTIDQHSSKILLKRWSATSALLALQFFLVVVATGCEQALPDIRGLPTYLRIQYCHVLRCIFQMSGFFNQSIEFTLGDADETDSEAKHWCSLCQADTKQAWRTTAAVVEGENFRAPLNGKS